MGYDYRRWNNTVEAFRTECEADPKIKRLRTIKLLLVLCLLGLFFQVSILTFLTAGFMDLTIIWLLNTWIKSRKKVIKQQFLSL